ncbi:MAG: LysR family transcriptional regulator [Roseinatronobacter sp.]
MAEMNYNHLWYFYAVAQDGNLTRTARRLNVSQSALSAQIRALEDRLGHTLFDRVGRGLVLSEAGRIALDHAETIFRTGDNMLATLRQTGQARQIVRVGALATLSRNFQLEFLRPLILREDVEVILRSASATELLAALKALSLDVVLTNEAAPHGFFSQRIAEQPVSLIGAPTRAQSADVADLIAREPLILPTLGTSLRTGFDQWANRRGLFPKIAAEVDDIAMMRLLARADAGLAVLPPIAVRDELDQGLLVEALRLESVTESFFAVTMPRRFRNTLVDSLLMGSVLPVAAAGSAEQKN